MKRRGVLSVERVGWGIGIKCKVDTSISQHLHGLVMALAVVDRVNADGIDTKLLEETDIAAESVEIEQRVGGISGTTRLICYTADIEPGVASPEGVASDFDLVYVRFRHGSEKQYDPYRLHRTTASAVRLTLDKPKCAGRKRDCRNGCGLERFHCDDLPSLPGSDECW